VATEGVLDPSEAATFPQRLAEAGKRIRRLELARALGWKDERVEEGGRGEVRDGERIADQVFALSQLGLESAPPGQDMGPEASRRFVELLRGERELLLLYHDYWSHAVRDPALRRRYARRRAGLRARLGRALKARIEHLGGPADAFDPEAMATIILSLGVGLAQERLIAPEAVPDALLGDAIVLLYKGIVASAGDVGSLDDR
jgi:hypothetical protein